jgi:hypothetical protein
MLYTHRVGSSENPQWIFALAPCCGSSTGLTRKKQLASSILHVHIGINGKLSSVPWIRI